MTPKRSEAQKLIAKAKRTALEDQFLASCMALGLPEPEREFQFCERRWKFDFAWLDFDLKDGDKPYEWCKGGLAVEIEGGTWVQGRHNRGAGFDNDCQKYNTAALQGWRILRFTGDMVKSLEAAQITKEALGGER